MKRLLVFAALVGLSMAQFPNGRVLEAPNPQLCANRIIHERAPDGKGWVLDMIRVRMKGILRVELLGDFNEKTTNVLNGLLGDLSRESEFGENETIVWASP